MFPENSQNTKFLKILKFPTSIATYLESAKLECPFSSLLKKLPNSAPSVVGPHYALVADSCSLLIHHCLHSTGHAGEQSTDVGSVVHELCPRYLGLALDLLSAPGPLRLHDSLQLRPGILDEGDVRGQGWPVQDSYSPSAQERSRHGPSMTGCVILQ